MCISFARRTFCKSFFTHTIFIFLCNIFFSFLMKISKPEKILRENIYISFETFHSNIFLFGLVTHLTPIIAIRVFLLLLGSCYALAISWLTVNHRHTHKYYKNLELSFSQYIKQKWIFHFRVCPMETTQE